MTYSSIRDNHAHGSVGDYLKENIKLNSEVAIVSAYFTIYAYHNLKGSLDDIKELRFLFGEPTFIKNIDPDNVNYRDFKIEDDNLVIPVDSRLSQKNIAKTCVNWIRSKVEIRSMVKPNFLHGKLYHIKQESGVEKAISGSSNFTVNGLGLGGSKNIELNMVVDSDRDRAELKEWFNALWNDQTGLVEDVKEQVIKYLEQLYVENTPEFIYYKTLYHVFESFLEEQKNNKLLNDKTGFYDSEIWNKLYNFQKDGVRGAINKIQKHNGCIIADSVGLGKTFEALAVIKYFELLNFRVLLVCPKKLAANWTIYQARQNHVLNPFRSDRFDYTVIYHTDMCRERGKSDANGINLDGFHWEAYDLVVIDESHNFRGNPLEVEDEKGEKHFNRAKWLMERIIKAGGKTKVLMLSATPVNNTLRDLRNQISYITEGKNDAFYEQFRIKDISLTLKNAQTHFTNWADSKKNPDRNVKQLIEKLDSSFFKLLDELTIARSRKHIKNFYDMAEIGKFPEREKPISVYPKIDLQNRFPSYENLDKQIQAYKLSIFSPSKYVLEDLKKKYGIKTEIEKQQEKAEKEQRKKRKHDIEISSKDPNFDQADREISLIGMMKVNYLKRLESSIHSFEISLDRTIRQIEELIKKIEKFKQNGCKSESIETPVPTNLDAENGDDDFSQVGKKLKINLVDIRFDDWIKDLNKDKEALIDLWNNAKAVTADRDAKLADLKGLIKNKSENPFNGTNKKVVIFTAFADTAIYLYNNLKSWFSNELKLHSALVCGSYTQTSFGENNYDAILTNFAPLAKNRAQLAKMNQNEQIDILIATDCISEGQNLQDCDYLINYDIHWNPVRIIQRFGRIDRLGSINKTIQLVNFWPTADLDSYINLKERVESRMALVDITATGEDNILNNDQIQELVTDDLKYRNRQLKKLKEEVLDLEEMNETVSLTDFTLDDFRIELVSFIENNKRKLAESPLGLYAIVPAPERDELSKFSENEKKIMLPGVIFCLRQKGDSEGNEEVNPLSPYFLVYVRNDGTVRYNFSHAKHILEIFRLLCQGKNEPYHDLCELFNMETKDGCEMNQYIDLLKTSISEIVQVFKKRGAQRLTSDREALLIPKAKQLSEMQHFELVTWLLIK